MSVSGVRDTLPPFGRYQLVVRDGLRHADHVPEQRKSQPPSGAGERAHIEVCQIQSVCVGRAIAVGDIGKHNASDHEPPDHGQSEPVQLLVSGYLLLLYKPHELFMQISIC